MEYEYSKKEESIAEIIAIPNDYNSTVLAKYCGDKQVNRY